MTEIIIIVAIANNGAIGINNKIPWHIKEDFKHFKNKTFGFPVIMGDRTFESLPASFRPLPGRENIVLTFDKTYRPENATVFNDYTEAIRYVNEKKYEKAFIIGGSTIYRIAMEMADTLEITKIKHDYSADAFFPEIDLSVWEKTLEENNHGLDVKNNINIEFSFQTYKRK